MSLFFSVKDYEQQYVHYRYGVDQNRFLKHEITDVPDDDEMKQEATLYAFGGQIEEIVDLETLVDHQIRLQVNDALQVTLRTGINRFDHHYMFKDRLGSTSLIYEAEQREVVAEKGYDAFGKPRNGGDWSEMKDQFNIPNPALDFDDGNSHSIDISKRGFTGHEHLDAFDLIHMNGRMYDFNSGRFLSVDPFIQGIDSQAINPYSYIGNNPLSGVDPTGYRGIIYVAHIIKEIERAFRRIKSTNRKYKPDPEIVAASQIIDDLERETVRGTPPLEAIEVEPIVLETPVAEPSPITTPPSSEAPDLPNDTADNNGIGNEVPDTSIMNSDNSDRGSESERTRREQNDNDTDSETERAARRKAFRDRKVPTSKANNFKRKPDREKTSKGIENSLGPNGEPPEKIITKDLDGNEVIIKHHKWGHKFDDNNTYEESHYHGNGHHSYNVNEEKNK